VAALRRALLDRWATGERRGVEALWDYSQRDPGRDDIEVFERLSAELPASDPRHPVAAARLASLLADDV